MFVYYLDKFCGEPEIHLSEDTFHDIMTLSYPNVNIHRATFRCNVIITVPEGRQINVYFEDLGLYPSADVMYLNNRIYTGFTTPEKNFISDGNSLELGFYSWGTPFSYGFHVVVSGFLPPGKVFVNQN